MHSILRISKSNIIFVSYDATHPEEFVCQTFAVQAHLSITTNISRAMEMVEKAGIHSSPIEIFVNTPVTPVPIAEFQEEDAETTWKYCFSHKNSERIFYDIAPSANVVLLYAINKDICQALESNAKSVHFNSIVTPLVQHFSTKTNHAKQGKQFFIYSHDQVIDIIVYEYTRFLILNTFSVQSLTDVSYYTLYLAQHIGADVKTASFHIVGDKEHGSKIASELKKYVASVNEINPITEFHEHPMSKSPNIPFDVLCYLLK